MPLKRIVLKIGSNSLASPTGGLSGVILDRLAYTLSAFREGGAECILVSSGAVAAGMGALKMTQRPHDLIGRQALAAVGQGILIEKYSYFFSKYEQTGAQILLSPMDIGEAAHYRNAQNTINKLLKMGVIPIINENDTVVIDELCFGDNDRLSALVAGMLQADLLIMLTDVDGLYTANPKKHKDAQHLDRVEDIAGVKKLADGQGSAIGTGGMITKIKAAEIAANLGVPSFVTSFEHIENLTSILQEQWPRGTYFVSPPRKLTGRKGWLTYGALTYGHIAIDAGAKRALKQRGASLLASGIIGIEGSWERKEPVRIVGPEGEEVARGLAELSSQEINDVIGLHTNEVLQRFSDLTSGEVVHCDNMTVF
ncbi:MAG: glutamate 5-kinase [Peptococcaceae bacterium]|nr:glutamate 5-kinase [Peptococcaceae bacterium]